MTVIALPQKHQDTHRVRTAMRHVIESLEVQDIAVKEFQENMKKLDQRMQKLNASLKKYSRNLSNVQTKCSQTRKLMPDALARAAG